MVRTSQQALAVCCEPLHIVADAWLFVCFFLYMSRRKHLPQKRTGKVLYFIRNVYEVYVNKRATRNNMFASYRLTGRGIIARVVHTIVC
jgi:hypothetical protein